ncbi:MAG: hypothetical protein FWB97_04125 [Oscillospiraceae bacterium]|nr:hypothetical protein [Oscillospiraceae bacterium]
MGDVICAISEKADAALDGIDLMAYSSEMPAVVWENVQTRDFNSFSNSWSAGNGYHYIADSGPEGSQIRLVSTGNRIYAQVPAGAFEGAVQIVVRHGNQYSITTITISGEVGEATELVAIGVGAGNSVSQVMIGSYENAAIGQTPNPEEEAGPGQTPNPEEEAGLGQTPNPEEEAGLGQTPNPEEEAGPGQTPNPEEEAGLGQTPNPEEEAGPGQTPNPEEEAGPGQTPNPEEEAGPGQTPNPEEEAGPGQTPNPELASMVPESSMPILPEAEDSASESESAGIGRGAGVNTEPEILEAAEDGAVQLAEAADFEVESIEYAEYIEIEDENVPLAEYVDIFDEAVPLGEFETVVIEIVDEAIPLSGMPQTGITGPGALLTSGILLSALLAAAISYKIRKMLISDKQEKSGE